MSSGTTTAASASSSSSPSASAPSSASTPAKKSDAATKMQQLLALARERLREQQEELASRDATIRDLRALGAGARQAEPERTEAAFRPTKAWCQVCEASLGLELSEGRWVLFEGRRGEDLSADDATDGDDESVRDWRWLRFADAASLEDFVRRDPGTEPVEVPAPAMTEAEARATRDDADRAVAKIADDFRKFRVQTEIERKRRDALDKEAAARREMLEEDAAANEALAKEDLDEEAVAKLTDERDSLKAENDNLKAQLRRRQGVPVSAGGDNNTSGFGSSNNNRDNSNSNNGGTTTTTTKNLPDDASVAAKWRQRYEGLLKDREKLASHIRSLTEAGAESSEYAALARDYEALQREFKQYRANALKAMRVQEQDLKARNAKAGEERKALDTLGGRSKRGAEQQPSRDGTGGDSSSKGTPRVRNDEALAKIQYLKNLMSKYLATSEHKAKEHMERAILMVLGFSDDEKKTILANAASANAAGKAGGAAASSFFS